MTLTEFLLARIAEDEAVAQRARRGRWKLWGMSVMADIMGDSNHDRAVLVARTAFTDEAGRPRTNDASHICRWDPARVLAECEAKRRIVEFADEVSFLDFTVQQEFEVGPRDYDADPDAGDLLLRLLALSYADHPDYREEWRP